MKTFAANFSAKLAAETAAFCLLLDLELSTPVYFSTCGIPVVTGGRRYLPRDFTVERIPGASGLAASDITIEFAAVDQAMAALVLGEDVAGKGALLRIAALESTRRVVRDDAEQDIVVPVFRGMISAFDLDETRLSLTVVNELILWNKRTLRKSQPSCPWPFKVEGSECGYTGPETWCDQSYARCQALGNTANYGGFRFVRATMEKEIKWGRY